MLCRLRESENQFFAAVVTTEIHVRIGGPEAPELVGQPGEMMVLSVRGGMFSFFLLKEFEEQFEPIEPALVIEMLPPRKAGKGDPEKPAEQPEVAPVAAPPARKPKTSLLQRVRAALAASKTGMSRADLVKELSATSGQISMSLSYLKKQLEAFKVEESDLWRLTNAGLLLERRKRTAPEQQ